MPLTFNILTHSLLNNMMKNNNIYQSFIDNLNNCEEQDNVKALSDFIKYLGFEDFEKAIISNDENILSVEVLGIDDRRMFIDVFEYDCSVIGKWFITDSEMNILDDVSFKRDENNKWVEVE